MSAPYRVTVDRDRCIGAGQCVLSAQEVFDQDETGVVVPSTPTRRGPDGTGYGSPLSCAPHAPSTW